MYVETINKKEGMKLKNRNKGYMIAIGRRKGIYGRQCNYNFKKEKCK